jgi:hypothetical protein
MHALPIKRAARRSPLRRPATWLTLPRCSCWRARLGTKGRSHLTWTRRHALRRRGCHPAAGHAAALAVRGQTSLRQVPAENIRAALLAAALDDEELRARLNSTEDIEKEKTQ